ncbi:hypothetical protein [Pseudomonas sp. PDM13]|uniref:hypothetical protein n=1 Tax=Pseudomonas sp. PDM13 TaxID=2769255 RepID=UPI0021E0D3ED|nr:hypothetical protein [Pseudomonas sp. PDM13]MCU9946238.1 hypothetical protein [Pseudomonas sp. PDM13]
MKGWIGTALVCSAGAVAVAGIMVTLEPTPVAAVEAAPVVRPRVIEASTPREPVLSPAPTPAPRPAVAQVAAAVPEERPLDQQDAILFMQMMEQEGDPRRPELGGLKPRQGATAAELADPRQYAALEDWQARELVQAYTSGVQQIPEIRARIEAAAQSGERTAAELDEARAALQQLEALQSKLERQAPQLLPGGTAPTPPKP